MGCYLSGGLDSCAVLGFAARHAAEPIRAFTLAFDQVAYDEEAIAREMAAMANAEFCPIPIRQADLADDFADSTWHSETFCLNAHGVAKYALSRAVRDAGYKVVLTGEGSDEILAGYPHFRRDMLLYDSEGQDPAVIRSLMDQLEQSNTVSRGLLLPDGEAASLAGLRRVLGFVPTWMEAAAGRMLKMQGLWADDFQAEFAEHEPYHVLLGSLDVRAQLHGRAPVNQALYLWAKTVLPGYILTVLGDRMEMAHSVEGRVPFLDHEVVELLRSMPVGQKIRGMTEKFVLREAARPVLTDTVYRRQKHPFLSPPATLNPNDRLHEMVQDALRGSSVRRVPFLDQAKVVRMLDRLPDAAARGAGGHRPDPDDTAQRLRAGGAVRAGGVNARLLLLRPGHRDPGQAQLPTRVATQCVCHHGNAVGHTDDLGITASLAAGDDDRR